MIVDDHAVVRSGLSAFLMAYDDLQLVAEARDGSEAIRLCNAHHPDVILMDLIMPNMDGTTAIKHIRDANPQVQIIALTSFFDAELVQASLKAGAIGYLLKHVSADELANAVRAAKAGQPTLTPEATQVLIQAATRPPAIGFDLTPRELEVLSCLVSGMSNPEIAQHLNISISTAKFHVSAILSKLEVQSRTEAVAVALQNNLVK
ncbi:MAG: response regulator transcription factor [Caldilineales bacterium]|nr:response regulator transcription factor [Caldilineales bacterium]